MYFGVRRRNSYIRGNSRTVARQLVANEAATQEANRYEYCSKSDYSALNIALEIALEQLVKYTIFSIADIWKSSVWAFDRT